MSKPEKIYSDNLSYVEINTALHEAQIQEIADLRAELARIKAKSEERKAALERVEWVDGSTWEVDYYACPWCERDKPEHAPDCPRQKALKD